MGLERVVRIRKRWKGFSFKSRAVVLESNDPDLRNAYRRYKGLLRRIRVEPAADETDDDVITRVRLTAGDSSADAAVRFVEAYRMARFSSGDKSHLTESLRTFEESLKRAG